MAKNTTYDDLIEKFLEGSLSETERKSFEERLKSDKLLAEKLSERLMIQESWIKVDQHEKVKRHVAQLIRIEKNTIQSRGTRLLAAASLILLISISSILFIRYNPKGDERNYQAGNKGSTGNKSELMVRGQKNEIPKFGTSDTIYKESSIAHYLPKNGMTFQTSDTIVFSWPKNSLKERLMVFDENWMKVTDVPLPKDVSEYKLFPSKLKAGTYTWILTPNGAKSQLIIKE